MIEVWKNLNAPIGGKAADYDFIFVITKSDVLVIPILCSLSHIHCQACTQNKFNTSRA